LITVSDSSAQGTRPDGTGPALTERCRELGWQVVSTEILADDRAILEARLSALADSGAADLILAAGGTGIGPRDSTPEATAAVCVKLLPGLGEVMREKGRHLNERAVLSRAIAGLRARTIIVDLPGSPRGAVESFDAVQSVLAHAVEVVAGARHD
jgi:molybdenum cofactor synthesis domain-containing protein